MHIAAPDVSFIGPWMHRDALRPEAFDIQRPAHHIGVIATACIPKRGQLVDIDTQSRHRALRYFEPIEGAQKYAACDP